MSVPLHLRIDAVGPLSPERDREREDWETMTWFDNAVLRQDPTAERFAPAESPEWTDGDSRRRKLSSYLGHRDLQSAHGGRRVARRVGHVPFRSPFDLDEDLAANTMLAAIAACSAHADLVSGPPAPGAADDRPAHSGDPDVRPPPAELHEVVHALTAAPSAPPLALVGR